MSIHTAGTIDVHAHAVLEVTMGAAGHYGPELGYEEKPRFRVGGYELHGVRYRGSPFMEIDLRLAAMAAAGIDYQVLSPNPLSYFHFIEADAALRYCRIHNDALAAQVAPHGDRLAAFAAVPMQDIDLAIAETRRAVTELGMLGPYIGTDFGRPLDDPSMDRFYAALVDLDVPLFIHPAPAGIDGPAGDANLRGYDLDIIVGFSGQETIAVCRLIYGGVLERHPGLDVCISHGGGFTGFAFGRMAMAARKRPWASEALRRDGAFEALLNRLWFDVHVHSDESLALLKRHVNTDHLVFGTNFAGWDQQAGNVRDEAVPYTDNARRLLRAGQR
ncbi:MAG: amidohydrolase [Pseudomonadales bacterium]|nr:amidohydrolase [Pseudomonadales bacterium]MCP5182304.1 amidohydrolase [Pseudomonadales bacterium]